MIEGMIQEVEYGGTGALRYVVKKNGLHTKPDAAPTIAIYSAAGTELVSATSMSAVTPSTGESGFVAYDAQTANFSLGTTLTGGTSTATARIEAILDAGTTGVLALSNIQGTFQNNETITDTEGGSATEDGAAYTCEYSYSLTASATGTYTLGENYFGKITYVISSTTYHDWLYFDIVLHTFMEPIITSEYINKTHPDWIQLHPRGENVTWVDSIQSAHAQLSRLIRKLGNRPACMVKREELFDIEMALVEAEIAKRLTRMDKEQRDFWIENAAKTWAGRGEFTYNTTTEAQIVEGPKIVSSGFTR